MKFKLSAVRKMKAIGALAVVFLLVLATNQMDSKHFKIVKRTLATVYEDRLVANDYLYKISTQLNEKHLALYTAADNRISTNDSVSKLVKKYTATQLTNEETKYLNFLKLDLEKLNALETQLGTQKLNETSLASSFENQYTVISNHLDKLSKIQLEEGKVQIQQSNKAISTSDLMSSIEIITLIIIGILIQLLIFYKPKKQRTDNV